ncbi:hypothetical protein Tco_0915539, partial [Tanacetum coccineum]
MNTPYPLSEQKVNNSIIFVLFVVNFANMAPLPPREQRHPFLRYQGLEYTDENITNFEEMLERIYSREIHRVQVVVFQGMPELMRDGLFTRMRMGHRDDAGKARRRLSWRQFILALGLHTGEEMKSLGFARYWSESKRMIPGKGDLHDYWRDISTDGDFLGPPPFYTLIRDLVLRLCHQMMAHSIAGRSQAPKKVTVTDLFYLKGLDVGSFVARLAEHFGILTAEKLGGLTAWVAMGPERQPDAVVGAPVVAEDALAVDEGDQAVFICTFIIIHVMIIKPGSKFSTIVHEYTEPSRIFTLKASMEKRDDFKCVEAEDKSNLKTLLETKVLPGRQPRLLFNFIESVIPDINTA